MNKTLLLFGVAGLSACGFLASHSDADAAPQAAPALEMAPVSYAPLVEALSPAVVNVDVEGTADVADFREQIPEEFRQFFNIPDPGPQQRKTFGSGSGFVISADGYVLTNNHVVKGADSITVTFTDGAKYTATLVGTDERVDVALLKLEGASGLPYVALDEADDIRVGDRVVAMGNPFGLGHTVTTGIISGQGRALGAGPYDNFLQTDAAINPGNSGGPLFDLEGQVVGMNTAIIAQGNNTGFSIPSSMILDILPDLKTDGKVARGWLGVGVQTVTPELSEALALGDVKGVVLSEVHSGSPADKAGLRDGDVVMTVAGTPVADSSALIRVVGQHRAGEKIEVELLRDGKEKTLDVKLGERPSEEALARGQWDEPSKTTPEVTSSKDLGFTLKETQEGLVVAEVDPDGPAAGVLLPGDVVLEINRKRAPSASEAMRSLSEGGESHLLVIQRGGRRIFVPFKAS
jgi:serine protease Do